MTAPTVPVPSMDLAEFDQLVNRVRQLLAQLKMAASAEVEKWFREARKLLADNPKLQQGVNAWIHQALPHLVAAETAAGQASSYQAYWTGAGADEFDNWVGGTKPVLAGWKTTISSAAASGFVGALNAAGTTIATFFTALATALHDLISGLTEAVGELGGVVSISVDFVGPIPIPGITINPGAATKTATTALRAFLAATNSAFTIAVTALSGYQGAGNALAAAGGQLTEITPPTPTLRDLEVRPAGGRAK